MALQVMVVGSNSERTETICKALLAANYKVVSLLDDVAELYEQVCRVGPDVIIIDIESPGQACLAYVQQVSRDQPRPIVMFADKGDASTAKHAVRAGVSAYVVDGLQDHRICPILETAVERFKQLQDLRSELEKTKNTLAERKLLDRAKGIVMQQRGCNEEEAYHSLRKLAMKSNKRLVDVAEGMIAAAELFTDK